MRFVPAAVVSAVLVLSSPILGQFRAALQNAFPAQYRTILVVVMGGCVALGVLAAIVRIRTRRAVRYALLAGALGIGFAYALVSRTGDPAVDAVERFHFVEYGVVTLLFYFAWRPVRDGSIFILPILAGVLVGTLEEWFQWFVPVRVGEVRDVFLNLWAIFCGLLFSVAYDPPELLSFSLGRESRRRLRRVAAIVLVVFAAFFHMAHLGYEIQDSAGGLFRSIYSADDLAGIARERADRWRETPPLTWSRYSREDQYFSEGVALVRARNRCWDAGDVACAWRTNTILERYYQPVIDTASYVSATGLRWPADQRADADRRIQHIRLPATRLDGGSTIVAWPKPMFWAGVAAAMALLLWL